MFMMSRFVAIIALAWITFARLSNALVTTSASSSLHTGLHRQSTVSLFQHQYYNQPPSKQSTLGSRCGVMLSAVAEKIDSNNFISINDSQNSTHRSNDEPWLGQVNTMATEPRPTLSVAAGKGALITAASNDVHIRSSGSIGSTHNVSIRLIPASTPKNDLSITSISSGATLDDQELPKQIIEEKRTLKLPLSVVKSLKGVGAVEKVMSSLRTVAAARAAPATKDKSELFERTKKKSSFDLQSSIQSAVSEMLEEDETRQLSETYGHDPPKQLPHHNTILLNGLCDHHITIRSSVPNSTADKYIANLRLSVFSNFDEERQNFFRSRSVEVLNRRRKRGAVALIAEMPSVDFRRVQSYNEMNTRISSGHKYYKKADHGDDSQNIIIGSVECSQHEFDRTMLGNSRPQNSLLYVTEVAVCPEARRCGVGRMLMKGVEEVAALRAVESIYLHVDVTNHAAIAMYEDSGYFKLDKKRPIYAEFTTVLGLHDGALCGRCHYLMCKHLTEQTTWIDCRGRY